MAGLLRKTAGAVRRDWRTIDDPAYFLVVGVLILVGAGVLIADGDWESRVIGALLVPIAVLAVYRAIRALKLRER